MTLFEYLAAAYVLMLSLALLRAMSGVPYAARSPQRYWVHALWLATALMLCLVAFWLFWPYREVEWTIGKFVITLGIPALLFAHVSVLVPPDPAGVESWQDHFFAARRPLFATGAAFMVAVTISNQFALDVHPLHPSQLGNYVLIAIYAAGFSSGNPRVHRVLALIYPTLFSIYFFTLMTRPDAFFEPAS